MDEVSLVQELLRLKGIEVKLWTSVPSIYLYSVDSITITSNRRLDHGWILGYLNFSDEGSTVTSESLSDLIILINKINEKSKIG